MAMMAPNDHPAAGQLSLQSLPAEILSQVFTSLSARDNLLGLQRVSKAIHGVANQNYLWQLHCLSEFSYWDFRLDVNIAAFKNGGSTDWKAVFRSRTMCNKKVAALLQAIIARPRDRHSRITAIAHYGYDAKDFLIEQCQANPYEGDGVVRRYFSRAILDTIHRDLALTEWSEIFRASLGQTGVEDPASWRRRERAVGAFDLFVWRDGSGGMDEVTSTLDQISSKFLEARPEFDRLTMRQKALALFEWLRESRVFGKLDPRIDTLRSNLLGQALHEASHESNPGIASVIYCSIANRVGLNAYRCRLPKHFTTVVCPPPGITIDDGPEGCPPPGFNSEKLGAPQTHLLISPTHKWGFDLPIADVWRFFRSRSPLPDDSVLLPLLEPASLLEEVQMITQSLQETSGRIMKSPASQRSERDTPLTHSGKTLWNARACHYATSWADLVLTDPKTEGWLETAKYHIDALLKYWPEDQWLLEKHLATHYKESDPDGPSLLARLDCERLFAGSDEANYPSVERPPRANAPFQMGQVFSHRHRNWDGIVLTCFDDISIDSIPSRNGLPPRERFWLLALPSSAHTGTLYVASSTSVDIITNPDRVDVDAFVMAGKYFERFDRSTCRFMPLPYREDASQ